jgi:hypothetical protein
MQALVPFADGQISLRGFDAVNPQKLRTLAGEHLGELARADELQLVYLRFSPCGNSIPCANDCRCGCPVLTTYR